MSVKPRRPRRDAARERKARADVTELATRQHGLVSREQALARGITRSGCDRRLRSGEWVIVHSGVYAVAGSPETQERTIMAACLAAGGVASHRTAASLLKLPDIEFRLDITVPRECRRSIPGVTLHRVGIPEFMDRWWVNGIPATSVARTVVDLAGELSAEDLVGLVEHVLARRKVPLHYLLRRLVAAGTMGRKGAGLLQDLLADRFGRRLVDSRAQQDLVRLLAEYGLPPGVSEYPIVLPDGSVVHVDHAWPPAPVVLQVESFLHHSTLTDHTADIVRDGPVVAAGYRVLRTTPDQIRRDRERLAGLIRQALDTASAGQIQR